MLWISALKERKEKEIICRLYLKPWEQISSPSEKIRPKKMMEVLGLRLLTQLTFNSLQYYALSRGKASNEINKYPSINDV